MSLGPMGTSALAPIMRSGTGAFGSTCFWKFVGRTSSGSGHADGPAPGSVMAQILAQAQREALDFLCGCRQSKAERVGSNRFFESRQVIFPIHLLRKKLRG